MVSSCARRREQYSRTRKDKRVRHLTALDARVADDDPGCNPHTAVAAMPLGEWTRRLGAMPAEAYDCFMVEGPHIWATEYKHGSRAQLLVANGRLPSDHREADHPKTGILPPCSRWSRTGLRRR
jgi:hypothetical protein